MSVRNEYWAGRIIYDTNGRKGKGTGKVAFCQTKACHKFKVSVIWDDAKPAVGQGIAKDSHSFPCETRLTPHPTEPEAFVISVPAEDHNPNLRRKGKR